MTLLSALTTPFNPVEILESSHNFWHWLDQNLLSLSPQEWRHLLISLATTDQKIEVKPELASYQLATLEAIYQLLHNGEYEAVYQLYSLLLDPPQPYPRFQFHSDLWMQVILRVITEKEAAGDMTAVVLLRGLAFEIDPTHLSNLFQALFLHAQIKDDFSVQIYTQGILEACSKGVTAIPQNLRMELQRILDLGYSHLFIQIFKACIPYLRIEPQAGLLGWLSRLDQAYHPDNRLNGEPVEVSDLLNEAILDFWVDFFAPLNSRGLSIIAVELEKIATDLPDDLTAFYTLTSCAYFYAYAGQSEKAATVIHSVLKTWPAEKLQEVLSSQAPETDRWLAAKTTLYHLCYILPYLLEDPAGVFNYQRLAARCYGDLVRGRDATVPSFRTPATSSAVQPSKRLRVGYLSDGLRRHSVGYLSYQSICHHQTAIFEIYCYSYQRSTSPDDFIYSTLLKHVSVFRDLSSLDIPTMVQTIREDQLDLLIYLDSLTNWLGCELIAHRLAPIQISWLGGDATTQPEVDYFIVDPWVLPEAAQTLYPETLIRLPSFLGVDSFQIETSDPAAFYTALEITPETLIYWSAAIAMKRSPECIEAQLEILRRVPNSVLVIKGIADRPALMEEYRTRARLKEVEDQLRFLPMTVFSALHRAQLGLADVVLDTFPYTGATITVEALYMNVPVVTKVGSSYFNRMSYSLLKTVGLEETITYSTAAYIEKAVELGLHREQIRQLKQILQTSKRQSALWDAREFTRHLETAYKQIANQSKSTEQVWIPAFKTFYASPTEWNQAGLNLARGALQSTSTLEQQTLWEQAVKHWRQGLVCDPDHIPCWFNKLHGTLVLGDRSKAIQEAKALLQILLMNPERFESKPCTETLELIWVETATILPPLQPYSDMISYYQCHLVYWLATQSEAI